MTYKIYGADLLDQADMRISQIVQVAAERWQICILETVRTVERQEKLFKEGKSRTMESRHLAKPAIAIDMAPMPIDWRDIERFYYFGGYICGIAQGLDTKLRWGGDWDGDTQVKDQKFNDLVHFELVE